MSSAQALSIEIVEGAHMGAKTVLSYVILVIYINKLAIYMKLTALFFTSPS